MTEYPLAEQVSYKDYRIDILYDQNPIDPREFDNLGQMICFHNRYCLGDKTDLKSKDFNNFAELQEYIKDNYNPAVILPLRLYDHSGISMSTSRGYPYNDPWDSMNVGFIFITADKIKKEYGKTAPFSDEDIEKYTTYLEGEVDEYNDYLTGQVFGYRIMKPSHCDKCGGDTTEELDACWGYFGNEGAKYALDEAKSIIDSYEKHQIPLQPM